MRRVRTLYQQFIGTVKKILDDDEVPTDVLHSAARVIYDICVKSLPEDDYVEDHVRRSLDATAK